MRGRYRILMGAAAGVGKTYRMLQEGRQAATEGVDVVIGYLEPHDRPETTALAEGLEVVPRRKVGHGSLELDEFDPDAVIRRAPELALVDELAHTNARGSRNAKRYEDIEEVLDAGIDVISTVNVQHLESLNDAVFELTGVRVRETFPDRILDVADEVILVDLSPEALQQRLRAGKVYPVDRAEAALQNFFRADNLAALRELALREVVEDVGARRTTNVLDPLSQPGGRASGSSRSSSRSRRRSGSCGVPGAPRSAWAPTSTRSGCAARGRAVRGAEGAARGAPAARDHPRRALRRGGGRRPRRHRAAGRRRPRARPTSCSALPTKAGGARSPAARSSRAWCASFPGVDIRVVADRSRRRELER